MGVCPCGSPSIVWNDDAVFCCGKWTLSLGLLVDAGGTSAWLSDVDASSNRQRLDVLLLSDCGDDRPSVGSSPRQTDSSSPDPLQHKPQLPKVDYTKGQLKTMTCLTLHWILIVSAKFSNFWHTSLLWRNTQCNSSKFITRICLRSV